MSIQLNLIPLVIPFLICQLPFVSCGPVNRRVSDTLFTITEHATYTYNLLKADEKYFLPYVLAEVSGLTHSGQNELLCIDDESGRVYFYTLVEKKLVKGIQFHAPRDFEGIAKVEGSIYVLESDGDLHHFPLDSDAPVKSEKIETPLSGQHDTEGLAYDSLNGRLLIASKAKGNRELPGQSIWSYDLGERSLSKTPWTILNEKTLEKFFESNRKFDYNPKRINFKPSGVAVHPLSGHVFVIASIGNLMLELGEQAQILASYRIPAGQLGQPEGITFAPNGDLFLSSEGEGDRGYVVRFNMNKE